MNVASREKDDVDNVAFRGRFHVYCGNFGDLPTLGPHQPFAKAALEANPGHVTILQEATKESASKHMSHHHRRCLPAGQGRVEGISVPVEFCSAKPFPSRPVRWKRLRSTAPTGALIPRSPRAGRLATRRAMGYVCRR